MSTISPKAIETAEAIKAEYWNCWTHNWRGESEGYCIHAFKEGSDNHKRGRALCGVKMCDSGLVHIPDETYPSCRKCQRILRARGVGPSEQFKRDYPYFLIP